ncbi:DUF397 domain-containing protein [Dactylosporangium sp. NPDC049525]|uniref:DUF397 domain-containing protein n=1 Tax=Dactylosporangium sp. NPDC049525 TaxID=3154730 RepID=UPI0034255D71
MTDKHETPRALPLNQQWRTSSRSSGGNCVEVRLSSPNQIQVRDSKNRELPSLSFSRLAWTALIGAVKSNSLN